MEQAREGAVEKGFLGSLLQTASQCDGITGDVVGQIAQLRQSERILVDSRHLAALSARLGPRRAESYVTGRVEQMTDMLAQIEARYREGEHVALVGAAQRVSRMATEIGLTNLARVSRDLSIVARRKDMAALGAVWARLVRIGDRSLEQIWEQPGLSL